jgi:WASH complex subunit strumpellin
MPQHRSTALATQARMLYIILYFAPDVLDEQSHTMREIVDRHFAGADAYWVVPYYMGFLEELPHAWEPYKAAKAALSNTTNANEIKRLYAQHTQNLSDCRKKLAHFLTEGVLTEELCLEHTNDLLHCVRMCNVTIRWLMLHRRARMRKLPVADPEQERREAEMLLLVLMDTAQFEYQLRQIYTALMDKKEEMWEKSKSQVVSMLQELSEAFKGDKILSRIGKDEQLQHWFSQLAEQVKLLDASDIVQSGRKLHHLIAALVEVEQFHQIEAALQLKQFLHETRELLTRMIRVVSVRESTLVTLCMQVLTMAPPSPQVRESTLVTLDVVCDMSYAWLAISDYAPLMRNRIQRNPFSVLKLRATFLKLSSILESPLVRIQQSNSPDEESVSQYYSSEVRSLPRAASLCHALEALHASAHHGAASLCHALEALHASAHHGATTLCHALEALHASAHHGARTSPQVATFMRQVMQVIPENMFAILSDVVTIQANELRELPVKVERDALRDWAQLELRHRLARATHRISVLTEGVLTMQV